MDVNRFGAGGDASLTGMPFDVRGNVDEEYPNEEAAALRASDTTRIESDVGLDSLAEAMSIEPLVFTIVRALDLPDGHKLHPEYVARFLRISEPDAVVSYAEIGGLSGLAAVAEAGHKLATLYMDLGDIRVSDFTSLMTTFEAVKAAPVMAQPMLMDRWARRVDSRAITMPQVFAAVDGVTRWRKAMTQELLQLHRPEGAARAFVAEVRCIIGGGGTCGNITALADTAFSSFPIRAMGPMLSLLCDASNDDGMQWIHRHVLSRHLRSFLREPAASGKYISEAFSKQLCVEASLIFGELPDRATGLRSKFDVFCDRIGVLQEHRVAMRSIIEHGIASTLSAQAEDLMASVRSDLAALGIFEEDTCARVYATLQERARNVG